MSASGRAPAAVAGALAAGLLLASLAADGPVRGAEPASPGGDAPEPAPAAAAVRDLYGWLDPEEVETVLEALPDEEADQLADDLERLGLLAPPAVGGGAAGGPAPWAWAGATEWRLQAGGGRARPTGTARLASGPVTAALRWRPPPPGSPAASLGGWLEVEGGGGRLLCGGLGLRHGLGLVAAGPGRRRSPSAGAALLPAAGRLAGVTRAGADRSLVGAAVAGRAGAGTLVLATGRPAGSAVGPAAVLVRAAVEGDAGRLALLAQRHEEGPAASLAARLGGGPLTVAGELAAWRPPGAGPAQRAWAVAARLVAGRWQLQGQVAAAAAGTGPPLGERPACLPDWQGSGWALTVRGPLGRRARASCLLAGDRRRLAGGPDPSTRTTTLLEGRLALRPRDELDLELRLRARERRTVGRGGLAPWLPPGTVDLERRSTPILRVAWERPGLRLSGSARALAVDRRDADDAPAPARRRTLLQLDATWEPRAGWRLRGSWQTAWGQDVDLVTACQPLPGLLLPRHWGHWREGLALGVERVAGGWRLGLAGSARRPAEGTGGVPEHELHLRAARRW